ncbi:MAG TPA: hypothetical protein P5218_06490 [Planctomycetota bacterium]|nr:hypothetical protein [Planctomycetota bacterium]
MDKSSKVSVYRGLGEVGGPDGQGFGAVGRVLTANALRAGALEDLGILTMSGGGI